MGNSGFWKKKFFFGNFTRHQKCQEKKINQVYQFYASHVLYRKEGGGQDISQNTYQILCQLLQIKIGQLAGVGRIQAQAETEHQT